MLHFAGDPHAIVAAMEFSQSQTTLISPTKKGEVDASTLRKVTKEDGGTDMAGGIIACQSLFEQEPMRSTGRKKIMVLLTDGKPDSEAAATAAADKAKTAGITIVTMGVAGADLNLMTSVSSGLGYNFSAEFFDNDAANIGAEIAPKVCHVEQEAKPYTECRQVTTSSGLAMRQRPCSSSPSIGVTIPKCERFEYLASNAPQVSECAGDFSCWIEVIYRGKRGWVSSGAGTPCGLGSDPSIVYVAYCPADGCPVKGRHDHDLVRAAPRCPASSHESLARLHPVSIIGTTLLWVVLTLVCAASLSPPRFLL
jgi:hypothetical protein